MKNNLLILVAITSICFGWVYYANNKSPQHTANPTKIDAPIPSNLLAPNFTYTTIKGRTGELYDHQGNVVLLHFWATWCAPCLIEFPEIIELADAQQDNLTILAISTDENKADIEKFLKKLKTDIPPNLIIIHDKTKAISHDLYQTIKLPETYILSPNLAIKEKLIGPQKDWSGAILQNTILPLIP